MKVPVALHSVPEKPGVYLMKDKRGAVLYVGKAKNLFLRVKTYFSQEGGDGRPQIPALLEKVADVETYVVPSEKEALLLEAKLIQQYRPPYNILLKEDTSEVRLLIDTKHEYPSLQIIRINPKEGVPENSFGPFMSVHQASLLFDLLVRIFRLRQCSDEEFSRRVRPCLLYQIKRCSAPCVGLITQSEYRATIQKAIHLLQGKDTSVQEELTEEMEEASSQLNFEKADFIHKQLKSLREGLEKLYLGKLESISDADVIDLFRSDDTSCFCIMHYRRSMLVSLHSLVFQIPQGQSIVELDSLLIQYYSTHELPSAPNEILLSEALDDEKSTKEALQHILRKSFSIHYPKMGPKNELLRLAEENARLRLLQKKSHASTLQALLDEAQKLLSLEKTPMLIDCFDVSHLSGKDCVATCVSFKEGKPNKRMYRTFRIRSQGKGDPSMMKEAIERRYRSLKTEEMLPDLILVDGGLLQLDAAYQALFASGCIGVEVRALSKESARHDKGMSSEKIWRKGSKEPQLLEPTSSVLHLLQRIRDEAHRFSIAYQKKCRSKTLFASQLDDIPNIGPMKKRRLLNAFSGLEAISRASLEELQNRAHLSRADAERVLHALSFRG